MFSCPINSVSSGLGKQLSILQHFSKSHKVCTGNLPEWVGVCYISTAEVTTGPLSYSTICGHAFQELIWLTLVWFRCSPPKPPRQDLPWDFCERPLKDCLFSVPEFLRVSFLGLAAWRPPAPFLLLSQFSYSVSSHSTLQRILSLSLCCSVWIPLQRGSLCTDERHELWSPPAWLSIIVAPFTSYVSWRYFLNSQCLIYKVGT